ncbi:hypothetical protein K8F61_14530 [Microbacterium resistens]|uniref:Type II secretion system protein GspF domain-containing protein n=1 Tax=Microbacterium resistens TaxID=156977 RepID=A0ABY3RPB0_9MICO|nr:hypothetical protein [Microbacterium resistens]UGS25858.1 hypothetical protein K8F61_14530 [Microbacterium resistens]
MTDAEQIAVTMGASPSIWLAVLVLSVVLGTTILVSAGRVASPRLRADEERIDLSRLTPERLHRIRAALIPGRKGAWNAMVAEHDTNRLKAQLAGARTTRHTVAWSLLLVTVLLVASLLSSVAIYTEVGRTGVLSLSLGVRFVGLMFIMMIGWYGIPMFTLWARGTMERARMPFAWRLLARSAAIKTLSHPRENRWVGQENPREGRVTIAMTARLLSEIEAEVIEFFAKPRRSNATAQLVWRTYDAPRVSRVLNAKAQLLGQNAQEVDVKKIYDWIDLVVDELVNRKTRRRAFAAAPIAAELLEPRQRAQARRVLRLGYWKSPAGVFSSILALLLGATGVTLIYPELRTVFGPNLEALGWLKTIVLVAVTAVITQLVATLFRLREPKWLRDS